MSYFNTYKTFLTNVSLILVTSLLLSNCAHNHGDHNQSHDQSALHADASLSPKSGNKTLTGELHFKNQDGVLMVTGEISGLKPDSNHGFHIHETGDCSTDDATSAGGHFSPNSGNKHGSYTDQNRHAGDLGNLKSNKKGLATVNLSLPGLNLIPKDKYSVIGRSVIVHSNPDDFVSQPSGNAGARIGCGVIQKVTH